MRGVRASAGAAVLAAALPSGCANHLRTVAHDEEREQVRVVDVRYSIDTDLEVLSSPRFRVEFSKEETLETTVETTTITYDEATPYSGGRELYEVPAGAVALPFAVLGELADVLAFGRLPDRLSHGMASWALSALNPLMNAESQTRVVREEVARELRKGVPSRTVVRRPLSEHPVEVRFENAPVAVLHTDRGGAASPHVLELTLADGDPRPHKVLVRVRHSDVERGFYLDRRLTARIRQAQAWLAVLGDPSATPTELARAVLAIDQLGFARFSLEAEDEIYARLRDDRESRAAFRRALRGAYGTSPPASVRPGTDVGAGRGD